MRKTNEGGGRGAESIVLLIFVLWRCSTCQWARVCGLGQKLLFRASWNLIFSSRDLRWRNKHESFWLAVSAGYFYILFLWAIVVLDLFSCLVSPLQPTTKQITISINIFICLKFYTVWNQIIHFKVFNIQVRFKCENGLWKNSL